MNLTRRGFLGGITASIAAACLPKVKVEQPPPVTAPVIRWEQIVYGAPIIYMPRKFMLITEENI